MMTDAVMEFFRNTYSLIDKSDLITGVIIPIIAVVMAFRLVEKSNRKKECNRINIELVWIEREILENVNNLSLYVKLYDDCTKLRSSMCYILDNELPIRVMDSIEKLKSSYPIFDKRFLQGELSREQALLLQEIENLDKKIDEKKLVLKGCSVENTDVQRKICELEEQQQNLILKYKKEMDFTLFDKLKSTASIMNNYIDISTSESEDVGIHAVFKIIKNIFEEYNSLSMPNITDAMNVFQKLLLCNRNIDIFKPLSDFDDFEKEFIAIEVSGLPVEEKRLYDFYQIYANWKSKNSKVNNYTFYVVDEKWKVFQDDLVLINKSELYLEIYECYQKFGIYNGKIDKKIAVEIISEANLLLNKISKLKNQIRKKC